MIQPQLVQQQSGQQKPFLTTATTSSSVSLSQSTQPTQSSVLSKSIWQAYAQLQKTLDNLDHKVQISMKKHQSQFLHAYRTHIHKMRHQLQDIKSKSEEQEKMFSSNDRIRFLEKENAVFRDEAIRLYTGLEKKTLQMDIAKGKTIQAEAIAKKLQIQNKQLALQLKKLSSHQSDYLRTIQQLTKQKEQLEYKLRRVQQKLKLQRKRRDYMQSARTSSLGRSIKQQQYRQQRQNYNQSFMSPRKSQRQFKIYRNQLQQWFLQCIKSVKKQIHQRKNSSNSQQLDLSKIANIADFRLVDKLRLFQMLLQNEKLLNWLYNKIFPGRYEKINHFISQGPTIPETHDDGNSVSQEVRMSQRYGSLEQNLLLPKVPVKRVPSFSLRNQIVIKNGKMNISMA